MPGELALLYALALVTAYIPLVAIAKIGRMCRLRLVTHIAAASAVVAAFAVYDIWREPAELFGDQSSVRDWPSFTLSFCTSLGLFIANQLLEHHERGHPLFTHYADHFEDSWMRGFQVVVSVIFALLFWGVLNLGAGLFQLSHLDWFKTLGDWARGVDFAVGL